MESYWPVPACQLPSLATDPRWVWLSWVLACSGFWHKIGWQGSHSWSQENAITSPFVQLLYTMSTASPPSDILPYHITGTLCAHWPCSVHGYAASINCHSSYWHYWLSYSTLYKREDSDRSDLGGWCIPRLPIPCCSCFHRYPLHLVLIAQCQEAALPPIFPNHYSHWWDGCHVQLALPGLKFWCWPVSLWTDSHSPPSLLRWLLCYILVALQKLACLPFVWFQGLHPSCPHTSLDASWFGEISVTGGNQPP